MKAISPLVATVILIAITMSIVAIVGLWFLNYASISKNTIEREGENERVCAAGVISLSSLRYCNNYIAGRIDNEGLVPLGNISITIIYQDGNQNDIPLNDSNNNPLILNPYAIYTFNLSASSNYDSIWVLTNCTGRGDKINRSDVTIC